MRLRGTNFEKLGNKAFARPHTQFFMNRGRVPSVGGVPSMLSLAEEGQVRGGLWQQAPAGRGVAGLAHIKRPRAQCTRPSIRQY